MRSGRRVLALTLALGACQDLPQPFRHEGAAPPLATPEHVSTADIKAQGDGDPDTDVQKQAVPRRLTARIEPLNGLPGDGPAVLGRALKNALERRGILVVSQGGDIAIRLEVHQTEAPPTHLKIDLVWKVTAPDGTALGQIAQQGQAERAVLRGAWGDLARQIADGAASGLSQLATKSTQ